MGNLELFVDPDKTGHVRDMSGGPNPDNRPGHPLRGVRSCPADLSGAIGTPAVHDSASSWPYGTGGRCGDAFAATQARMLADIDRFGVRAALEHWERAGLLGPAVRQVLTDKDYAAMERACAAEVGR